MTIVVACTLGALGFSAALALALGRVAALADESSERMLAEGAAAAESAAFRRGYAGWARTQSMLARQSTSAVASSRVRAAARRSPVSSCAPGRAAVRSNRQGRRARP